MLALDVSVGPMSPVLRESIREAITPSTKDPYGYTEYAWRTRCSRAHHFRGAERSNEPRRYS
jgi:hypothetical protein